MRLHGKFVSMTIVSIRTNAQMHGAECMYCMQRHDEVAVKQGQGGLAQHLRSLCHCPHTRACGQVRVLWPLAQFGRPAVVRTVVERLLGEVAKNLAQAS